MGSGSKEQNLLAETDAATVRLMAKSRVMMVDDEPINMQVLKLHLKSEGYEQFVMVSEPATAMDTLLSEEPDVLLLDLYMPEISGFDILERVRNDQRLKQLPVIVLTSSNDPEKKLKALKLGATDFLSKPVDASELALRMKNTLVARAYEKRLMHYDVLTNLPNRLHFSGLVQRLIGSGVLSDHEQAFILINLARFKSINDTYGPDRGDDLIWAFSQRLGTIARAVVKVMQQLHSGGMVITQGLSRLGGDRFGLCVAIEQSVENDQRLRKVLQAILSTVEKPFVVDTQDVYLSLSLGVSTLNRNTSSVEALINEAETAMNHVRDSQADTYSFFSSEMMASSRRRLQIENQMRTCIDRQELRVLYQPKVTCATNLINSAEALIRWKSPEMGMVSPEEFIPVAESTGMIVPIGQWVLTTACAQAQQIRQKIHPTFKIAVNVSIRQLYDGSFIGGVKQALSASQLPPEALVMELTENILVENVESTIEKLTELKSLGVSISIDDFGTGYSSLSYLQRLPIDQLKIDRSFIMQIKSATSRAPIVKAVISLAHDLGLCVVAEGVEDAVQRDYVAALGCEEYQGYFRSPPVTITEIIQMVKQDLLKCA